MKRYIKNIKLTLSFLCLLVYLQGSQAMAQDAMTTITGKVINEIGQPIQGVLINSGTSDQGTYTDTEGNYTLSLPISETFLLFEAKGFANRQVQIDNKSNIDLELAFDRHGKDDVIALGYGFQSRKELTGSVSTVSGEELERSPVANLSQTFSGRFAGLTTQETFSELSRANTDLFVRGISGARKNGPLVVIDGIPVSYNSNQILEYISANEIASVSVLKDASTQAIYGIQGANGVIVITTKRGRKGPLQVKARLDHSVQEVTTQPMYYAAGKYAQMRNQAAFNDGFGEEYLYTNSEIEQFQLGNNPNYPSNDWYSRFVKDFSTMQRVGVNITGGNDKVQFFSNVNFMHQSGQFKTDQTNYDPSPKNIWVNFRSNVDMKFNELLSGFVRLSGNIKREHTSGIGNQSIYSSIFQIPPTMFGPVIPELTADGEPSLGAGQVVTTERVSSPTYGMLNRSGYYNHTVTNIASQFGLDLDMGFLTDGLNLSGVFAYQTNSVGSLGTTQDFERWLRTDELNELEFVKKGSEQNTPLAYGKGHQYYYHLSYNSSLNYQRQFGASKVSGMAYMFYQNLTKADNSSPGLLPYNRVSSGIEGNYSFDDRYLLKLVVGYSGSEQYARDVRYTTTPAVAGAWVISNESFTSTATWLSNLKWRASYGKTANDITGIARYAYLDNVTASQGGLIPYLQYIVNENLVGNPNISAEISTKTNIGIDLGIFNAFSLSVDVFEERMDNMIVSALATIPAYQGVPLSNYPQINGGQFENKGFEILANYKKVFNQNFSAYLGGMYGYNKNKIISWNEAERTDDYVFRQREEGYSFGQEFGYLVDYSNGNGYFNSEAELEASDLSYAFGVPRVGDLIYQDLNSDGNIDERDYAPIGNGSIPRTTYALSGGLTFKAFDLNFLFQGLGNYSTLLGGTGILETEFDGIFGSLHQNAWTAERYANDQPITFPALSLAKSVNHEPSDFVNFDRSFIRLKNLEVGYTLPLSVSRIFRSDNTRVLLSGQNLLTWDKLKTSDFGPEGGGYSGFPVYRVYNLGLSVTF
ncbi:SusC/RagA family TonB-linked outer membrane protein [uncultured Cyclobacterium sp.]|uniref:SusC/RagA family TonB-linked outer membrane protein n=1 Tax=uncultured Cyclobacterium sp. TaxID=453820 RepID=UPI0030EB9369|tara:strand:+ start:31465 stop:34578 length:3114 start_codon:yes stop_codon:yes gene_type:complete